MILLMKQVPWWHRSWTVSYNFTTLALVCTVCGALVFLFTVIAPTLGAYTLGGAALITVGLLLALRKQRGEEFEDVFITQAPARLEQIHAEANV